MKLIVVAATCALSVPGIAAQAQPPNRAPVVVGHPVMVERVIEEKPAFVVGPPAVIDSSGNPVMGAGRIVTSQSASPLVRDAVIVQERQRVTVLPEPSSSAGR